MPSIHRVRPIAMCWSSLSPGRHHNRRIAGAVLVLGKYLTLRLHRYASLLSKEHRSLGVEVFPPVAGRFVGQRVPRLEDARLLTGRGTFVDDVVIPGTLHAAFVRSPIARGK